MDSKFCRWAYELRAAEQKIKSGDHFYFSDARDGFVEKVIDVDGPTYTVRARTGETVRVRFVESGDGYDELWGLDE